jgi:hypothetical protein
MNVERIKELSNLLRNPSQWPDDFAWDFGTHDGCAMGLFAKTIGWEIVSTKDMAGGLGIPHGLAQNIFLYAQVEEPTDEDRLAIDDYTIMPEDVAVCLDAILP